MSEPVHFSRIALIGMGLIGLGAFIWALRHDQFDDMQGNAWRVLLSDDVPTRKGTPDDKLVADADDRDPRSRV